MASFWKPEACGQTVLPDMSVLIGQKLVENAKIRKFKCGILSNFQTMWRNFITANSFKPWKKNFLAQCLKCESMSRPTEFSSQLEVEKQTFDHLSIKPEIIDDSEMNFSYWPSWELSIFKAKRSWSMLCNYAFHTEGQYRIW